MKKIMVINGPNLNMLGKRKKEFYGSLTLDDINNMIIEKCKELNISADFYQNNCEGALIDCIQQAEGKYVGAIINAGAYSHYSYAIRDAIECSSIPFIEVHMSDIYSRDEFRRKSVITEVCKDIVTGKKENSYIIALEILEKLISEGEY